MISTVVPNSQIVKEIDFSKLVASLKEVTSKLPLDFEVLPFLETHVTIERQPKKDKIDAFLAEANADKITINGRVLDMMFSEMAQTSGSVEKAYLGLAQRLLLILTHERKHILDYQSQMTTLGFHWPLSSLQAELTGIQSEANLYGRMIRNSTLAAIFSETSPPRNYIIPGASSSVTEEFDGRIIKAHTLLEAKNLDNFLIFCKHYYPNAIDLAQTKRQDLELQLKAINKRDLSSIDAKKITEAIQICESPQKFSQLLEWYNKREEDKN